MYGWLVNALANHLIFLQTTLIIFQGLFTYT